MNPRKPSVVIVQQLITQGLTTGMFTKPFIEGMMNVPHPGKLTMRARQTLYEWLVNRLGGTHYILWDNQGNFKYAVGKSPEDARWYRAAKNMFTATVWGVADNWPGGSGSPPDELRRKALVAGQVFRTPILACDAAQRCARDATAMGIYAHGVIATVNDEIICAPLVVEADKFEVVTPPNNPVDIAEIEARLMQHAGVIVDGSTPYTVFDESSKLKRLEKRTILKAKALSAQAKGDEEIIKATRQRVFAQLGDQLRNELSPQECTASGAGHSYGPHGPHGETQCKYCGELNEQAEAAYGKYVLPSVAERMHADGYGWRNNTPPGIMVVAPMGGHKR